MSWRVPVMTVMCDHADGCKVTEKIEIFDELTGTDTTQAGRDRLRDNQQSVIAALLAKEPNNG